MDAIRGAFDELHELPRAVDVVARRVLAREPQVIVRPDAHPVAQSPAVGQPDRPAAPRDRTRAWSTVELGVALVARLSRVDLRALPLRRAAPIGRPGRLVLLVGRARDVTIDVSRTRRGPLGHERTENGGDAHGGPPAHAHA